MVTVKIIVASLLLATPALIAQEIPPGTVLPVMLRTSLDARRAKVGQKIEARVMQDVRLRSQTRIRAGAKLVGHVVEVTWPSASSGSRIAISLDLLIMDGAAIPVSTSLRALASMMDVFEAQLPTNSIDDYGTTTADWVTVQIGGDAVYRGNGTVMTDGQVVGKSTVGGDVTANLVASRDGGCQGAVAANDREQALWLFSPSACGVYGFADLKIVNTGRHEPVGQIILASDKNIYLPAGSGLLLRIASTSEAQGLPGLH